MDTTILIAGIILLAVLLIRPAPESPIIYVTLPVAEPQQGGSGCLPLILISVIIVAIITLGSRG